MANISDYLDWRADVPFSLDPFNEIDNLILSELIYTPFDGIISGPSVKEKISINDVCKNFFKKYTKEEIMAKNTMTKLAPFLMEKMTNSARYGAIKMAGYVNEIDKEDQSQFACVTFYLPDNTIYVAFRGTDDTLVGWREDFNMSFSSGTGGQLKAVKYLNDNFSRTMKKIRVGGHSKGGNFAVYASAFCRDSVKDNIIEIYTNDGPGFVNEVLETKKYKSIEKRIISIIPDQSIIGLLMEKTYDSKVVESDLKGINQHDPFSWQLTRSGFKEATLSESSIIIDEVITKWAVDFDYETRLLFGDILFNSLSSGGQTMLSQVTGAKLHSVAQMTKSINSLSKEQQTLFYDVMFKLMNVSGDTFKNTILEKLSLLKKLERKK